LNAEGAQDSRVCLRHYMLSGLPQSRIYQPVIMERLNNTQYLNVLVAVALVLACGLFAPTDALAQTDEENLVSVDASIAPDKVPPGAGALLNIKLNLAPGAHANSNQVDDPNLIPTVFLPKSQAGLNWGQPKYPQPTQVTEWYSSDPLSVFEDGAEIKVPLTIEDSATPGQLIVEGSLRVQVCDSEKCYPVRRVPVNASLLVGKEYGTNPNNSAPTAAQKTDPGNSTAKTNLPADTKTASQSGIEFDFVDFTGKPRKFSEFRGKFVLLDFWATWCKPCLADIPHLKGLYEKYKGKGFDIIGMDSETLSPDEEIDPEFARERQERARNIVKTRGASWTHATSETAVPVAVKVFKVESLPTKVLIDREGKVVARIKEGKELDEILAGLLDEKQVNQ
jgi:thiol-disulfide isomerase/thioredoxin